MCKHYMHCTSRRPEHTLRLFKCRRVKHGGAQARAKKAANCCNERSKLQQCRKDLASLKQGLFPWVCNYVVRFRTV